MNVPVAKTVQLKMIGYFIKNKTWFRRQILKEPDRGWFLVFIIISNFVPKDETKINDLFPSVLEAKGTNTKSPYNEEAVLSSFPSLSFWINLKLENWV